MHTRDSVSSDLKYPDGEKLDAVDVQNFSSNRAMYKRDSSCTELDEFDADDPLLGGEAICRKSSSVADGLKRKASSSFASFASFGNPNWTSLYIYGEDFFKG
jgi:hypothetical protein